MAINADTENVQKTIRAAFETSKFWETKVKKLEIKTTVFLN